MPELPIISGVLNFLKIPESQIESMIETFTGFTPPKGPATMLSEITKNFELPALNLPMLPEFLPTSSKAQVYSEKEKETLSKESKSVEEPKKVEKERYISRRRGI